MSIALIHNIWQLSGSIELLLEVDQWVTLTQTFSICSTANGLVILGEEQLLIGKWLNEMKRPSGNILGSLYVFEVTPALFFSTL